MQNNLCTGVQIQTFNAICGLLKNHVKNSKNLLDVGCWDGNKTIQYGKIVNAKTHYGIEVFQKQIKKAKANGIKVFNKNIENCKIPIKSSSIELVICNQVFEHLKNIFFAIDEINRILKINGYLIISVPNLASFHNRILLLLGFQPSCIRVFGPHIRGFSFREFSSFLTQEKNFKILKRLGVGFYPFRNYWLQSILTKLLISHSHTPIWLVKKTTNRAPSLLKLYNKRKEQTIL